MKTTQLIPIIQKTLILISLLYLTLAIPILITTYSTKWYEHNYEITDIKNNIAKNEYETHIDNLISYLSYQSQLNENWSQKEKEHYKDVRQLYLIGLIIMIILSLTLFITFKKQKQFIEKATIINIIILSTTSILILTFFQTFWDNIFHPLLFNNMNYLMTPNDLSYYIFSLQFFSNTVTFIIFSSIIINAIIYTLLKTQNLIKTSKQNNT